MKLKFENIYIKLYIPTGMFNTSGVQDMMSQLTSNPDTMTNMMQSPYVRSMMQQMANNPETMQQVRVKLKPYK